MERVEADCSTGESRVVKLTKKEQDEVRGRPDSPEMVGDVVIDVADLLARIEALEAKVR